MGRETMVERSGDVFGERYGEVLLVRVGESGPAATVYNSFPLNDCPAELWDALDADAIHLPGVYVQRIVCGAPYDKKIEFRTVRQKEGN